MKVCTVTDMLGVMLDTLTKPNVYAIYTYHVYIPIPTSTNEHNITERLVRDVQRYLLVPCAFNGELKGKNDKKYCSSNNVLGTRIGYDFVLKYRVQDQAEQ